MTLRGRIVLWSAAGLLTLFALVVLVILGVTQTDRGREEIRKLVVSALREEVHGSVYVGRISSGLLTGVTIDSLAIRDPHDSLFLSTGRLSADYDLRDLADRRILLRNVRIQHPFVRIKQHENGDWNFAEIFPPSKPQAFETKQTAAFIVIDSAVVHDATFLLTLPWHVSPTLPRAVRDSVIHFELASKDQEIRRTSEGFARTWRWTHGDVVLTHGRVSHPDSLGSLYQIASARATEIDPPFLFSNVRGTVRQLGDSVWVDFPHFDLPGSTGHGAGKVVWGGVLPVRYDIHVHGDSVSLNDVAWVYPTLPRTGGGVTDLAIRTESRNPDLTDFALTNMDVRSTRSHLLGRMTFTIGEDTLLVKDVQMAASPLNFDLLRVLNGKPFPYDWQGDFTGTVRASGGNLARFKVEDAKLHFADANVPGATTDATAHGELNIFDPAFTAFNDLYVDVASLDLRTLQYLNKNFPRLNGTISGTAVLDSSWLDLRFRDAQLTHSDGADSPQSRVSGNGRVTWGDKYLTYDLDLQAQPIAFETIRKSYPLLPLRASLSGPIRVQGQSPDLLFAATLSGDAGTLAFDGRIDIDPPTYGAHGTGSVSAMDLRPLLGNQQLPRTSLTGNYAVDVSGDSMADLAGTASAALAESRVGAGTIRPSSVRLRFGDGLMTVDTIVAAIVGARAEASGTVGMANSRTGSLRYNAELTSIDEVERLLGVAPTSGLGGKVNFAGTLSGALDALRLIGTATGTSITASGARVGRVVGHYALSDLGARPSGTVTLKGDSIIAGSVPIRTASAEVSVSNGDRGAFRASFAGTGTISGGASGTVARDSTNGVAVALDSARVNIDSLNSYALTAPVHLVARPQHVSVDSVMLLRAGGGVVAIRNAALSGDSIRGSIRTSGFSLGFLELFGSAMTDLRGALTANVDVTGTTGRPRFSGNIGIDNGAALVDPIGVRLEQINANVALDGDSVVIRTLSAATNRTKRGTLDVTGGIGFADYDDPTFVLKATARNFRAIDKRGLATLDVTTVSPITLTGSYTGAVVSGAVRVDRGTVYIPEVIRKRVVDLNDPELLDVIDTTLASNRAILPVAPSQFTKNLTLQNVAINIGDDVWLRSDEADIKLGGSLNVTLGRNPATGDRSQLALEGQLNAVRGTYRLNVVPFVQPTFEVEQGTLRFFGTPDLDPALDITAINTVRRPIQSINGQDVRIRATIGGTLSAPTLTLSSADNLPLSQSDLLSYLITGEPAFALDYTTNQYVQQLANVAVRSAGNVLSSAIPHSLFDVVELQTPAVLTRDPSQTGPDNSSFYNNLLGTRAILGKQLNNSLFLNFSTGFCSESFRTPTSFEHNVGLRLEYRFARAYTAQFGLEPGTSDLVCARSAAVQSILQTPPQLGFDVLHTWRF